jgi:serine/threonine kinase 32
LKPENILLDHNGHAHLTDFNIAVHFSDSKVLTSKSGTRCYMGFLFLFIFIFSAPEVFGKVGYRWQVDWWSTGIVVFELLFGKRPFSEKQTGDLALSICTEQLEIPKTNLLTKKPKIISQECESVIKGLLMKAPEERLCCIESKGFDEFKSHPWFTGIDWIKLGKKEFPTVFKPDVSSIFMFMLLVFFHLD